MRTVRRLPPMPAALDLTERVAAMVCELSFIGPDGLRGSCDCERSSHGRARCDTVLAGARQIIKLVKEEA